MSLCGATTPPHKLIPGLSNTEIWAIAEDTLEDLSADYEPFRQALATAL